ncbi:MAG: TIGR02281 family clan AA aspartic protease [Gammaproteobacteria bacterium]|jgi:aspartyl protease family protein|nr:TIGR02281 family clan AA aspartic protease [Gammaproteobacteria bacterium]
MPDDLSRPMGRFMLYAMWLVLLGLAALFFQGYLDRWQNPNGQVQSIQDGGAVEVRLQRNRYGHYVMNGYINDQYVTFMVDTGASTVAVPGELARELKLSPGARVQFRTAAGPADGFTTRIETLRIGEIELHNVRASISPRMRGEVLLGMSVLRHLDFSQNGDVLTLRQTLPGGQ